MLCRMLPCLVLHRPALPGPSCPALLCLALTRNAMACFALLLLALSFLALTGLTVRCPALVGTTTPCPNLLFPFVALWYALLFASLLSPALHCFTLALNCLAPAVRRPALLCAALLCASPKLLLFLGPFNPKCCLTLLFSSLPRHALLLAAYSCYALPYANLSLLALHQLTLPYVALLCLFFLL